MSARSHDRPVALTSFSVASDVTGGLLTVWIRNRVLNRSGPRPILVNQTASRVGAAGDQYCAGRDQNGVGESSGTPIPSSGDKMDPYQGEQQCRPEGKSRQILVIIQRLRDSRHILRSFCGRLPGVCGRNGGNRTHNQECIAGPLEVRETVRPSNPVEDRREDNADDREVDDEWVDIHRGNDK